MDIKQYFFKIHIPNNWNFHWLPHGFSLTWYNYLVGTCYVSTFTYVFLYIICFIGFIDRQEYVFTVYIFSGVADQTKRYQIAALPLS